MSLRSKTPRPGRPVRGSKTGRPVMALFDLLGRRGALRILWELKGKALRFRPLSAAADLSPAVLNARLAELKAAALVEAQPEGYVLTSAGRELSVELMRFAQAAERWATKVEEKPDTESG